VSDKTFFSIPKSSQHLSLSTIEHAPHFMNFIIRKKRKSILLIKSAVKAHDYIHMIKIKHDSSFCTIPWSTYTYGHKAVVIDLVN
jgi:hypothetical protein